MAIDQTRFYIDIKSTLPLIVEGPRIKLVMIHDTLLSGETPGTGYIQHDITGT